MTTADIVGLSREYKTLIEEKKIPPSAKIVYDLLKKNGLLTAKVIIKESQFAPRTVRYALKKLLEVNMIQRLPNLDDMRQHVYKIVK